MTKAELAATLALLSDDAEVRVAVDLGDGGRCLLRAASAKPITAIRNRRAQAARNLLIETEVVTTNITPKRLSKN